MSQKESTETQQACMVLTSYLSSHRMRKTPERYEILKAVHQFAEPFDINQIQEKLKDSTISISLSTIYNTFTLLENAQLLVRTKPNGRYNKYMARSLTQDRRYVICSGCGQIWPSQWRAPKTSNNKTLPYGFKPIRYTLFIYGQCRQCQQREQKE